MLYTRKGDSGTTKLFGCDLRLSKTEKIFFALGTVDELNSLIGFAKVLSKEEDIFLIDKENNSFEKILEKIQNHLFSIQAELAQGGENKEFKINQSHIDYLEEIIETVEKNIPPINSFIISGGNKTGAFLDICRTNARHAERVILSIVDEEKTEINKDTLVYINRLSSFLYALARFSNHKGGEKEKSPNYSL
jgi:cob(I)alamin adenosyltransferase